MRVGELMTTDVATCTPVDTLNEAARLMWERDCGCVPVTAGEGSNRVVGVITDRDICMASFTQGRLLRDLRVADAMSTTILTCRREDNLGDAQKIMRGAQVRRLPVVGDGGDLHGLLSLADLAREAKSDKAAKEVRETLAAIAAPRPREHA